MTWTDLVATAAAIPLVVVITNALRMAFGWSAPWVALVVAFVLELGVWWFAMGGSAGSAGSPAAAGIALLNVFVVYVGATGGNEVVRSVVEKRSRPLRQAQGAQGRRENERSQFWQGWF